MHTIKAEIYIRTDKVRPAFTYWFSSGLVPNLCVSGFKFEDCPRVAKEIAIYLKSVVNITSFVSAICFPITHCYT